MPKMQMGLIRLLLKPEGEAEQAEDDGVDQAELDAALDELGIAQDTDDKQEEEVDPSTAETVAMERIVIDEPDDGASGAESAAIEKTDSGLDETPFNYGDQPGYEYGVAFDFGDEYAEAREPADMESAETYMPSPENTAFFDVSEQEINKGARQGKREKRKARGCGLKIAIFLVIVCILIAAAACAAYVLGYGYPLQETVTEQFFSAVQNNEDTSKYWADDVDKSTREAQISSLEGLQSYEVEAVQRKMSQTAVFVKGVLKEGGQIDYEVVLTRKNASWAIEYVQLYFPSEQ